MIPGERLKSFSPMKFDTMPRLSQPRATFAKSLPEEQMRVGRASVAEFVAKGAVLKDVRNALKPNMYGCVIDISDAYYHVSIHKKSRKYTRFILDGDVYEYLGLPMGLTCSPRIFTKVSKAVADVLWKRGIIIIIYIDVSYN